MRTILVTGANGNLGRRLLNVLQAETVNTRALVRSESARQQILTETGLADVEVMVGDYLDEQALATAVAGCDFVVHLVGIIKASANNGYFQANVETTRLLGEAATAAGVGKVVFVSIVGASLESTNECLRSKAQAEHLLLEGAFDLFVLRVPMVLGEKDYASYALGKRARTGTNFVFNAGSLEQPIYAGDVIAAMQASLAVSEVTGAKQTLELAGPESLTRRRLIERAAATLGKTTRIVPLPAVLSQLFAKVAAALLANPPITPSMLGVLDHDDNIEVEAVAEQLGVALTSLDDTLAKVL